MTRTSNPQPSGSHGRHPAVLPWVLLIGGLLLLSLAATVRAEPGSPDRLTRTDRYTASGNLRSLQIENVNGDVTITAGSSFAATVEVSVRGGSDEARKRLDETKIAFSNEAGDLSLKTEIPSSRSWSRGWSRSGYEHRARYDVTVPAHVRLEVSLVNGNLKVKGLTGEQELSSVNGRVDVDGARGDLKAETVNGRIEATFTELPKSVGVDLETVNGSVVLRLPQRAGFELSAHTMSGDVVSTFDLPVREGKESDELRRERDKITQERRKLEKELADKKREMRRRNRSEGSDIVIDLSELHEAMGELNEELARLSAEMAVAASASLNREYEGSVNGGGARIEVSTLNGKVSVLAEGVPEDRARTLVSGRIGRIVEGPAFGPRISVKVPKVIVLDDDDEDIPEPPAPPKAPKAPRVPKAPSSPEPPAPPEPPAAPEAPSRHVYRGSITRGDVEGDFLTSLPWGDISVGKVSGKVRVSTRGGQIRLSEAGQGAELGTSGGDIRVEAARADLRATTQGGDIRVGSVAGEAKLETQGGDVIVGSSGGPLQAHTGGGDIRLSKVRDAVKAETSGGSITCELAVAEVRNGIELSTHGGDVTLLLPANFRGELEVRVTGTLSGDDSIRSEFPELSVSKRTGAESAEGKLNGGGGRVVVRCVAGTVRIRKGPAV